MEEADQFIQQSMVKLNIVKEEKQLFDIKSDYFKQILINILQKLDITIEHFEGSRIKTLSKIQDILNVKKLNFRNNWVLNATFKL